MDEAQFPPTPLFLLPLLQVIAVDEAQFFPDLREFSLHAADLEHKHIVLAGLDGDFQRQRFGQVGPLQWTLVLCIVFSMGGCGLW